MSDNKKDVEGLKFIKKMLNGEKSMDLIDYKIYSRKGNYSNLDEELKDMLFSEIDVRFISSLEKFSFEDLFNYRKDYSDKYNVFIKQLFQLSFISSQEQLEIVLEHMLNKLVDEVRENVENYSNKDLSEFINKLDNDISDKVLDSFLSYMGGSEALDDKEWFPRYHKLSNNVYDDFITSLDGFCATKSVEFWENYDFLDLEDKIENSESNEENIDGNEIVVKKNVLDSYNQLNMNLKKYLFNVKRKDNKDKVIKVFQDRFLDYLSVNFNDKTYLKFSDLFEIFEINPKYFSEDFLSKVKEEFTRISSKLAFSQQMVDKIFSKGLPF